METISSKRNNFSSQALGLLLQIPVFIVSLLGIFNLIKDVILSFTNFDYLSKPQFVGLKNYEDIFSMNYRIVINNTQSYMLVVFVFSVVFIISALFIAKLKPIFGVLAGALLSVFSLSAWFVSFPKYVFSNDSYGFINSTYMSLGIFNEPIEWLKEYGSTTYLIFAVAAIAAPLFMISYLFAKAGKRKLGVIVSICVMPILFANTYTISLNLLGYPAYNYSDWLPLVIKFAYQNAIGSPSALWIIAIIMFLLWCAIWCGVILLFSKLFKRIKMSDNSKKVIGYLFLAYIVISVVLFALPNFIISVNNSLKPLDELLIFPQSMFVKRPTISNYTAFFEHSKNFGGVFSSLSGVWVVFTACIITVVPSAVGFAFLKTKKSKISVLCAFIPWLAFLPFSYMAQEYATIRLGEFFTGFGAVVVFLLTYYLTKMLQNTDKITPFKIITSVVCVLSTILFLAATSINFGTALSNQMNWIKINECCDLKATAGTGMGFAGDVLLFLFTLAAAIVPIVSFFAVWLSNNKSKITQYAIKKSEE